MSNEDQKSYICKDCGAQEPQSDYSIDVHIVCKECEEKRKKKKGLLVLASGLEVSIEKDLLHSFFQTDQSDVEVKRIKQRDKFGSFRDLVKVHGKIMGRFYDTMSV